MNTTSTPAPATPDIKIAGRITSVDFFRGFTMFLLAGEATGFIPF